MSNQPARIKQSDAKRLFKAVLDAGFERARIILHPDGRIEADAALSEAATNSNTGNTWDDVLK